MHQLILTDLCDSPEEEREFVGQAHESALKLVQILDSLLDVAKTEHGTSQLEIQPIQLAELLQQVYTQTYLQAKDRNLRLEILLPDPNLYGLADPRCLQQVLVNLIDTAILQMEQGKITVSAHADDSVQIWIEDERSLTAWQESTQLLQSPPQPHQQVPSPGLNLLINQTLLELMQGRLELLTIAAQSPDNQTDALSRNRIQCSIPLLVPEAA